ncbi:MAG: fumarate hydratase [Dehalococcoidia bacterium]|nr:fumarate hydratase [Dehalococcoidia bacterium]RLC61103.1 MAG: fumarate hydratase [Chloroflexota bacterium]
MREIEAGDVTNTVARLFERSCHYLPTDVIIALKQARQREKSPVCRSVLDRILENVEIAGKEQIPLCQDTGAAVVMLELGQEVHVVGGDLYAAVNEGVRQGYSQGYLRKSIVNQPCFARMNTRDNTPAMIHTDIVSGDRLKISVLPKGGGSENCSRLAVLPPAKGRQGVIDFVVNLVDEVGGNPCPPVIIGVGIGGTTDKTMLIAKKALLRKVSESNPDPEVADLEREILERVNNLGIGAMGYGGTITALAVHVEAFPCHIASMPVAVNLQCWCARREEAVL